MKKCLKIFYNYKYFGFITFSLVSLLFFLLTSIKGLNIIRLTKYNIYLIILVFLPWCSLFVKKVRFGDNEIEFPHSNTTADEILKEGLKIRPSHREKILATLWIYQKEHFGDSQENRWTFTLQEQHPNYYEFIYGIGLLLSEKLIAPVIVDFKGEKMVQYALTDEGIRFMKKEDNTKYQDKYF
jgi:hypothetical protein